MDDFAKQRIGELLAPDSARPGIVELGVEVWRRRGCSGRQQAASESGSEHRKMALAS
jgi:hypothetical protein